MMCCSSPKEHAIDLWSSRAQAKSLSARGRGLSALLIPFFLPLASQRSFLRNPFRSGPLGDHVPASSLQHLDGVQAVVLLPSAKANDGAERQSRRENI